MAPGFARAGAILLAAVLMTGCGSKEVIVLMPSVDGVTGKVVVTDVDGNNPVTLDAPLASAQVSADGVASALDLTTLTLRENFGDIPTMMPAEPADYTVYFKSGTSDLTADSVVTLNTVLEDLRERPGADVEVVGHTDTVGSTEANDKLSVTRAEVVGAMLRANAIDGSLIRLSGRGERELRVYTKDNVDESRNRRVQIIVR